MQITCAQCRTVFTPEKYNTRYRWEKEGIAFCENNKCGWEWRTATQKPKPPAKVAPAQCSECGTACEVSGWTLTRWKKDGRAYCSKACSSEYRRRISSETMARTNRKYASERMTNRNPMMKDGYRLKMIASMQGKGPKVRGGNGQPPTKAEVMLMQMFEPLGFVEQLIFRTGHRDPTHYKIDCGHPYLKIAIEADGFSHNTRARKAQDARKDARLTAAGWKVFRFTNQQILEEPSMVMSTILKSLTFTPTPPTE